MRPATVSSSAVLPQPAGPVTSASAPWGTSKSISRYTQPLGVSRPRPRAAMLPSLLAVITQHLFFGTIN